MDLNGESAAREGDGVVVIATDPHYCRPPGGHRWGGHIKNEGFKPYGTVWRCDCGRAWIVGHGHTSLWESWDRCRKHDGPPFKMPRRPWRNRRRVSLSGRSES